MNERSPQLLASGKLTLDWPAEHVVCLTLKNTRRRNALDHELLDTIAQTVPTLKARCLIISGSDGMFSAGYDIANLAPEKLVEQAERLIAHPFTAAIEALAAYPYPTLAVLNGHAIGGGLELALSCDLRVAATNIKLGMPPAKLGLIYSHTGMAKFIEIVGAARTRELFLLGRNVDAQTAHAWGMVNHLVSSDDVDSEGLAIASELANNAPISQRGNKAVIDTVLREASKLDDSIERQLIELRRSCFSSADFREGVEAFTEKRKPRWLMPPSN
jgi:enoyl-CoA hydratase/carnithine racemase